MLPLVVKFSGSSNEPWSELPVVDLAAKEPKRRGASPANGGATPIEGMGERGAREMRSSCIRGATEM